MGAFLVVLAAATLRITDAGYGRAAVRDGSGVLIETGASFADGSRSIPSAAVSHLHDVLVASEHAQQFDAASVGITRDSVVAHRADLVRAMGLDDGASSAPEVAHLTYERVVAAVAARYAAGVFTISSDRRVVVRVVLDGANGFSVASEHDDALMLPWTVTVANHSFKTYSPDVSRAVAALLGDVGNRELVENFAWWAKEIWNDIGWIDVFREDVVEPYALRRLRSADGYAQMLKRFEISEVTMLDGRLLARLKPRRRSAFSAIRVSVAPDASWTKVIARLDHVEKQLVRMPRTRAWWRAPCVIELDTALDASVLQAWKDLALDGRPDLIVELDAPRAHERLVVGPDEDRVLSDEKESASRCDGDTWCVIE